MNASPSGRAPIDLDILWDFDHPDSSETSFRALLPSARDTAAAEPAGAPPDTAAYGPAGTARGSLIELLTQIARAEGLQRRFDEADATLDEAQALLRADLGRARVRVLLERGRVFNTSGRPKEARPLFLAAWDLAHRVGEDALAVDAGHMIAIVSPADQALEWNFKALALAETSPQPKARRWRGSLYNNIGWTYHGQGDYETALENFRSAYEARLAEGNLRRTLIAKWCIARCLRSLGKFDEALAMQEELAREWEKAGFEPDGEGFEERGECLLALGKKAEARPLFAKAYELLSKDGSLRENEPERLARLAKLGGVPEN